LAFRRADEDIDAIGKTPHARGNEATQPREGIAQLLRKTAYGNLRTGEPRECRKRKRPPRQCRRRAQFSI